MILQPFVICMCTVNFLKQPLLEWSECLKKKKISAYNEVCTALSAMFLNVLVAGSGKTA